MAELLTTVQVGSTTIPNDHLEHVWVESILGRKADSCEILIYNPDGLYTGNSDFVANKLVNVWIDQTDGQTIKVFRGIIRQIDIKQGRSPKDNYLKLLCRDRSSIFGRRLVKGELYKKGTEVSVVFKSLINKYASYLTTNNVATTTTNLKEDYTIEYKYLNEVLDYLADLANCDWYVDVNDDVHLFDETGSSSGVTITEADLDPEGNCVQDADEVVKTVTVIGGKQKKLDVEQAGNSVYKDDMNTYWYAEEFTPSRPVLYSIIIYAERFGNPEHLRGQIRADNNGTPQGGAILKNFEINYITAADWYPIILNLDLMHVHPFAPTTLKIWVILEKCGDASNKYRWYNDGGTSGTHAYSQDGETWTVTGSGCNFAMKTYYSYPVIVSKTDGAPTLDEISEIVIKDAKIRERDLAMQLCERKLADLSPLKKKGTLNILAPTTQLKAGQTVVLNIPNMGFNNVTAKIVSVKYSLDIGTSNFNVSLDYCEAGSEYGDAYLPDNLPRTLSNVIGQVRTALMEDAEPTGYIELLAEFLASLGFSITVTPTTQTSGTFVHDTARHDFCDHG